MATINIQTNIAEVNARLRKKIEKLKDKDYLLRPVCFDLIDLMTKRIHEDGIASDGNSIGEYSNGYLKQRQKKYGRNADKAVVISLTRQLENDWSVIPVQNGYGIGFKNKFNLQKARWCEETYDKPIFSLSANENKYASDLLTELVNKAMQSND